MHSIKFLFWEWSRISFHNQPFSGKQVLLRKLSRNFIYWTWYGWNWLNIEILIHIGEVLLTKTVLIILKMIKSPCTGICKKIHFNKNFLVCCVFFVKSFKILFYFILSFCNMFLINLFKVAFIVRQRILNFNPSLFFLDLVKPSSFKKIVTLFLPQHRK